MDLTAVDYELPPEAIARTPAATRDASRLLVIDRARGTLGDHQFRELPELLRPGDCVVVNDSRVIPARVHAEDGQGRPVELLFLEPEEGERWRALVRPGRRCPAGTLLTVGKDPNVRLRIAAVGGSGERVVERLDGTVDALLDTHGVPPLPPYIARHRAADDTDRERYQTVYARVPGSVAAPTAGLHLSHETLAGLRAVAIEVHALTLHVGAATFRPLRATGGGGALPSERVTIPPDTAAAVTRAVRDGRRVVAIGTTTTRALEGLAREDGGVASVDGRVDLCIGPDYRFRVVRALVTNFHLPRTSLLMLVAAFAGCDLVLRAYRHAIAAGYRFYSYGDATLIV